MIGTPCDVPDPRKVNSKDMRGKAVHFSFHLFSRQRSIGFAVHANEFCMLTTLRIKNLALVADLTLELQPGLNIITGETGTGKSILIGALNLVLGERADRTLIRAGAEACLVEAVFDASHVNELLAEHGLEPCENGQLILKRTFSASGTRSEER